MRKFRISTGKSRLSPTITRKTVSWKTLAKRLLTYDVIDLSFDAYSKLDRETQSAHKDVGYFIGGWFNEDKRLLDKMATRCCIALDIDHVDAWDLGAIEDAYAGFEYVVHSTLKHSDDTPRLRLVFPLERDITPDKYEPVARKVASWLGMDCFDDTTFQPARIMFWPAVTSDGDIFKHHNKGAFVDSDEVLNCYDDWQDFASWPHSSRVKAVRPSTKKAEDPLTKKGIIGAFNRTYDIHAAIERFELPYESTDHDNRYRPFDATGPSGAVVYDDVFLYSHHESDVVGQQNVNAWDLVRLHKFGESDASKNLNDIPIMQHPSSKHMVAMAAAIPAVEKELRTPAHEMEDEDENSRRDSASDVDTRGSGRTQQGNSRQNETADLTFDSLLDEISEISPKATNLITVAKSMIPRIAAAKLDPQDIDVLAGALRLAYPKPYPAKAALVAGIKQAGKRLTGEVATDGHLKDMERELIAAALAEHYASGDTLKRVGRKCWTYEQGVWAIEGDEPVRGKLAATFTRLREERPEDMLALVATVGEGKTSALVKSVWGLMCDDLSTKEARDDPLLLQRSFPLPIINCMNCEIYIDVEGVIDVRDHDPHNFYTTRIDTRYDPKATCPEWDRFMQMVFSNTCDPDDMVRHFEELGGYVIQFSRWLKTWVMFHGETDTGKSSAAMVMQELLGNAYTGKPMAKLNDNSAQFAEAGLIGKLLMVDDDFAYDGHLPDGFLKTYSEEKPVTASIKYGDDVNFKARALPLILSNHYPVTRDTTGAFIERALVIPFTHRIVGRDKDDQRRADMMKELPGILNRFLAGISRLRKRGTWDRPLDCVEVEQTWINKSNPFLEFTSECLLIKPGTRIKRGDAFEMYKSWHQYQTGTYRHGNSRGEMGRKTFNTRMSEKFGDAAKAGDWYFNGVCRNTAASFLVDELESLDDGELPDDVDDWDR